MALIASHRRCPGCGYDLFGLETPGKCLECARAIRPSKKKAKNPRRQAASYRTLILRHRSAIRSLYSIAAASLIGFALCVWFEVRWILTFLSGVALVTASMSCLGAWLRIRGWEERVMELEVHSATERTKKN
jgi:hypothetical protein